MSYDHGAHGVSGATDDVDAMPASEAMSTDATLESRVKRPHSGMPRWVIAVMAAVVAMAVVIGVVAAFRTRSAGGAREHQVVIGLKLAPTNLDIRNTAGTALDQVLIGNVMEGLVARNSNNEVVPSIAKSWTQSDDGLTYVFHLNEGMTFSNGDELTAKDVAWSLNELIDKQYHAADDLASVKTVTADESANTVTLTLSQPNSNLLWNLSGRAGLVYDQDATYDAKTEVIGSGPYVVADFAEGDSITLKANEHYWGTHAAKTPTIVIKYYADDNAGINALKSGDIQEFSGVSQNMVTNLGDDFTVTAGDGTDKYVLAFNNASNSMLADKRIRQAIRYGINHDEIIASRGGADVALGGPIPDLDPGYEDLTSLYPYDQAKAKSLMKEAGYSTEKPLKLTLTYANIYASELGDQLRSQLAAIGIDLKVNIVEFSTWLQDVYTNHDYDLSLVDHNESHDFSQWANPEYYYGFNNADVQRLYAEGIAATSESVRDAKFAEAARIVSEEAAADWLFSYRVTTVLAKGLEGFPINLNQTLMPLYDVEYVR